MNYLGFFKHISQILPKPNRFIGYDMISNLKLKFHVSTCSFEYNRNSSKRIADKNKMYTET